MLFVVVDELIVVFNAMGTCGWITICMLFSYFSVKHVVHVLVYNC